MEDIQLTNIVCTRKPMGMMRIVYEPQGGLMRQLQSSVFYEYRMQTPTEDLILCAMLQTQTTMFSAPCKTQQDGRQCSKARLLTTTP